MKSSILFLSALSVAFSGPDDPTVPTSLIRTSNTIGDPSFYDDQNRVRIFHGFNRVRKSFPWRFDSHLDENSDEFSLARRMGLNVVRLGYMWSGVQPSEGEFNITYVEEIKKIISNYERAGVYVLLDVHEDVLSSRFCLYDGVPLWLANKSIPSHPFPYPLRGDCDSRRGWMENALGSAVMQMWGEWYDNGHGFLDSFAEFWSFSADQFKDFNNVLGYEILNEPFAGDVYADPDLLLPGVAGKKNLARMNERASEAIRSMDDRHIVFFEPVTWGMVLDGPMLGSGYDSVPGGSEYVNRSCFSYHYYCKTFSPNYETNPLGQKFCDSAIGPSIFSSVSSDLKKIGGGQMMTEGLSCGDDSPDECRRTMSMLDDRFYSYADYANSQGDDWGLSDARRLEWARPYARAIAGRPTKMNFDAEGRVFEFCFEVDDSIEASTEVYTSAAYVYEKTGFELVVEGNVKVDEDGDEEDGNLLHLTSTGGGGTACVHIYPKE